MDTPGRSKIQNELERGSVDLIENYGEEKPLLSNDRGGFCARIYPAGFWSELKDLLKLAAPVILTSLCQYMVAPVALMFSGHLGEIELAGVSLANSLINITAITVALGIATASDTLFSQVYGSTKRKRLGVYVQRSLLINVCAVFVCWAIHLNMEPLLRLLGQDPQVARVAAQYILVFLPAVPFFFGYVSLSKYLQCQNITAPSLVIGAIANGANALLHYLLLYVLHMGIEGSSISQVISYFLMMALHLLYIRVSGIYKETWDGFSIECLYDWGEFFQLGFYGLLMLCAEYWSFEIGILLAGNIGVEYLGAMAVIFQLETFAYMLPLGTGIAASIRVGQFLGYGDAKRAKTSASVSMTSACGSGLVVAILFLALRNYLPLMFTNSPDVIKLVSEVLPIVALYQVSDGLSGTGAGILRGQGRQHIGAIIVVTGYATALIVGSPLMLYTQLRLSAFWGALMVALTFEGVAFSILIYFNNWEKLTEKALARVGASNTKDEKNGLQRQTPAESVPLLHSNTHSSNNAVPNGHITPHQDQDDEPAKRLSLRDVLIRRLGALSIVLLIFIAGIFLRIFYTNTLEIPVPLAVNSNVTGATTTPYDSQLFVSTQL